MIPITYETDALKIIGSEHKMPDKNQLLSLLDYIIKDEVALRRSAMLSYRHQLGFEKYVLASFPSGGCLRMHFWDHMDSIEEDIHSHCASFRSQLWLGKLTEQKFHLTFGDKYSSFRYRFNDSLGESETHLDGLTEVQEKQTRTFYAGDSYTIAAESLHRVTKVAAGTLTVSNWDARMHDAIVLKPVGETAAPCCVQSGMEVVELKKRFQEIRRKIAKI